MTRFEQEQDRVPIGKVAWATAFVVVVSALFVGGAALLSTAPARLGQPIQTTTAEEVNEIETHTFDQMTAAERQAIAARMRLSSYGWVDRERRIIHIPLEVATDLYLSGRKEAQ